jgi:hypothetical protein
VKAGFETELSDMQNRIKNFFLICSGASQEILSKPECGIEHNKYIGIGATVFFTAALASISGGYALYTVFRSASLSIAFGMFWGLIIFNLDRYIVSTLKKQRVSADATFGTRLRATADEFVRALPRLALAIFISIVITKPIELKLFEREIDAQIEKNKSDDLAGIDAKTKLEFPDIEVLKRQNEQLNQEIKNKLNQRDALYELSIAEAIGESGPRTTGETGKGLVYKEREQAYLKCEAELREMKDINEKKIRSNEERIADLQSQVDGRKKEATLTVERANGLLARLKTLDMLSQDAPIALASWFIFLLFLSLETAPIAVKLLSDRGPYDVIYETMEHRVYTVEQENISDIDTQVALSRELNMGKLEAEVELSQNTMASLSTLVSTEIQEAQLAIARLFVARWKKTELEKMKYQSAPLILNNNGTVAAGTALHTKEEATYPREI